MERTWREPLQYKRAVREYFLYRVFVLVLTQYKRKREKNTTFLSAEMIAEQTKKESDAQLSIQWGGRFGGLRGACWWGERFTLVSNRSVGGVGVRSGRGIGENGREGGLDFAGDGGRGYENVWGHGEPVWLMVMWSRWTGIPEPGEEGGREGEGWDRKRRRAEGAPEARESKLGTEERGEANSQKEENVEDEERISIWRKSGGADRVEDDLSKILSSHNCSSYHSPCIAQPHLPRRLKCLIKFSDVSLTLWESL